TYLKSRWTIAMSEPYTTLMSVSSTIHGRWVRAPSGSSITPMRSAAYAPSYISTPAWIIDTAVGAATWPTGLQLWKGNTPARMPKPRKMNGNQIFAKLASPSPNGSWNSTSYAPASRARMKSTRSKVISSPASCATKYIAITPTSATIDPMRMYSVSFIDAYSRVTFQPQVAMSRYIGKMASS